MAELTFDERDMIECILALTPSDFYKSMPSQKRPGTFQDVYRPTFCDELLYIKVQISTSISGQLAVIISFKRKRT